MSSSLFIYKIRLYDMFDYQEKKNKKSDFFLNLKF